jgi:hypothetical protein
MNRDLASVYRGQRGQQTIDAHIAANRRSMPISRPTDDRCPHRGQQTIDAHERQSTSHSIDTANERYTNESYRREKCPSAHDSTRLVCARVRCARTVERKEADLVLADLAHSKILPHAPPPQNPRKPCRGSEPDH